MTHPCPPPGPRAAARPAAALALVLLVLAPGAARAQFDITTRHGDWTGSGEALRGDSYGAVRCRITLAPEGPATRLTGRCAAPEGAYDLELLLTPQPDGSYVATGGTLDANTTTRIERLSGRPDDDALTLTGSAGPERATLQFVPLPDRFRGATMGFTAITDGYDSL